MTRLLEGLTFEGVYLKPDVDVKDEIIKQQQKNIEKLEKEIKDLKKAQMGETGARRSNEVCFLGCLSSFLLLFHGSDFHIVE